MIQVAKSIQQNLRPIVLFQGQHALEVIEDRRSLEGRNPVRVKLAFVNVTQQHELQALVVVKGKGGTNLDDLLSFNDRIRLEDLVDVEISDGTALIRPGIAHGSVENHLRLSPF